MVRVETRPIRQSFNVRTIMEGFLRLGEKRNINHYANIADGIIRMEDDFRGINLQEKTDQLRSRLHGIDGWQKESLEEILPEAFALVREASDRVFGYKHNQKQIMTGLSLHFGRIAEMKTGEGKTLAATLPAYLNALLGKGVHIMTANDYLAKRDSRDMGKLFDELGLSVGVLLPDNPYNPLDRHPPSEHRAAYTRDITYGTVSEFGFDYLRDNMAPPNGVLTQRATDAHHFAIIDEADSILIDQARTPLVITENSELDKIGSIEQFAAIAGKMIPITGDDEDTGHYEASLEDKSLSLTEKGLLFAESELGSALGIDDIDLTKPEYALLLGRLQNALYAKLFYKRDKDYIVKDGKILVVDEQTTGRILHGHRFSEGVHPAIEAKEGLPVSPDSNILASISIQNFIHLYKRRAGMTGTAESDSKELAEIYKMKVDQIPTENDVIRNDHGKDLIVYKTKRAKFHAIIDEIIRRHEIGQPMLIGTISIEDAEILADMLKRRDETINFNVIHAKTTAKEEARIVAEAGQLGAITIGTNIVGRGTDIVLGGDFNVYIKEQFAQRRATDPRAPFFSPDELKQLKIRWEQEKRQEVVDTGGLCVIGTELSESRRIDDQLRGRAGRQGDPGESLFFVSLEDEILNKLSDSVFFNLENAFANVPENRPITSTRVQRNFIAAQRIAELENFTYRKEIFHYDRILDKQRRKLYDLRKGIFSNDDLDTYIDQLFTGTVDDFIAEIASSSVKEKTDHEETPTERHEEPISLPEPAKPQREHPEYEAVDDYAKKAKEEEEKAEQYWAKLAEVLGIDISTKLTTTDLLTKIQSAYTPIPDARQTLLSVLDDHWGSHLASMLILQNDVQLRRYAQRDPFVEYHHDGEKRFNDLLKQAAKDMVVRLITLSKPPETKPEPAPQPQ